MGYYFENKAEDTSGLFTTLKGCVAAAEGVSERDNEPVKVFAQTSDGDKLVGETGEYETQDQKFTYWCFDFDEDWPFSKEL